MFGRQSDERRHRHRQLDDDDDNDDGSDDGSDDDDDDDDDNEEKDRREKTEIHALAPYHQWEKSSQARGQGYDSSEIYVNL